MVSHHFFVFVLFTVCLQVIFAAPKPNPLALRDRQDLTEQFAEFIHEDKELSAAFEKIDWDEHHLVRNRRQATGPGSKEFDDYDPPKEKPGFFDRAAKFVTELLQRFLKWVNNTDNN